MASPIANVGILSIGDMGMGIAKLLVANGFSAATNCKGRSPDTTVRAKEARVSILTSDVDLTEQCSVILSVVPPRDAISTAQRIIDALVGVTSRPSGPLYFADLNAVAPSTTREIAALISESRAPIRFIDGAIIGGPPALKSGSQAGAGSTNVTSNGPGVGGWSVPSIPTSGPYKLSDIPGYGEKLFQTLNMRHISPDIGAASGLKMCFASTTKGWTSILIQSFTTAQRLGVLDELKAHIGMMMPGQLPRAEKSVVSMAPKAYRWVREMEEIALTFQQDGGFSQDSFQGAAKVFRAVADSELGREKTGKRKRGTTVEDMAACLAEDMDKRRKKDV